MVPVTKEFLNNIENFQKDIKDEDEDDGYYVLHLCDKLTKKYINDNNNSISKAIEIFIEIFEDDVSDIPLLRLIASACICFINLRISKIKNNEEDIKKYVKDLNDHIVMIDKII